jgi:hypothetical protein
VLVVAYSNPGDTAAKLVQIELSLKRGQG